MIAETLGNIWRISEKYTNLDNPRIEFIIIDLMEKKNDKV